MLLQGVGISRVEVGVGRRSYFVIRVVVLIFSSRIKLATELYSVLLGMFTSRSTRFVFNCCLFVGCTTRQTSDMILIFFLLPPYFLI